MSEKRSSAYGHFWAVAAILVAAIAFGGGGSKYGMANLLVQLTALIALAFHREAFATFWRSAPLALRILVALSILLPAATLVPLPESIWSALPGRELVAQSFELAGRQGWAPASVEPIRTLLALTALVTPLALLTIGWSAQRERLITIGWFAVALGLANVLLGIPQVLSNSQVGLLYPENMLGGVLFGSFANRNSAGLFLVGALTLAALLPAPARLGKSVLAVRIMACVSMIVAILLTRSRTALVLALVPLSVVALRLLLDRMRGPDSGRVYPALIALLPVVLVVGVVGTLALAAPGRIGDVVERFEGDGEDARAYIWDDALYSAERYWPMGSGMGTFDDVFQVDESLENMTQRTAGRAHNDYLEILIEAGIPGLALIAAWLCLLAWLAWRARHSPERWIAWSGGIILLAIALQSITDYPLRNQSLLAFGAFALLLLTRFAAPSKEVRS